MSECLEILTLSKDEDKELYLTILSVVKSSKNLSINQKKKFKYTIIIKNFINSEILEKSKKILKKSKLKFEIISQESITKVEHNTFKTNGWYEAVYDVLKTVRDDSWLWFLNAGDYANISSLKLILNYYKKAFNKKYIGISFLTEVTNNKNKFIKPGFFFEDKNKKFVLSMLPCFQSVLIKAKYLKKFEELIYKGLEGIEQKIIHYYFKKNKICFIPECLSIFNYGGTSTTKKIGFKRRFVNIQNFYSNKRFSKLFSEIIKLTIDLLPISFLKIYFILFSKYRSKLIIKTYPFFKKLKFTDLYIISEKLY